MIGYVIVFLIFLGCTIYELRHDTEGRESGPPALWRRRRTLGQGEEHRREAP